MLNEKAPGSVWNVVVVAVAVFIGALTLVNVVAAENPPTLSASAQ